MKTLISLVDELILLGRREFALLLWYPLDAYGTWIVKGASKRTHLQNAKHKIRGFRIAKFIARIGRFDTMQIDKYIQSLQNKKSAE